MVECVIAQLEGVAQLLLVRRIISAERDAQPELLAKWISEANHNLGNHVETLFIKRLKYIRLINYCR